MDHAAAAATASGKGSSAAAAVPDRALLADIEAAVERCTGGGGGSDDDRHVHEILFLVSNAPGAITFLSRRITARLEAARAPAAALRSLLLVHRLLRAGDRYFEQDLRGLWESRDLRIDSPRCSSYSLSRPLPPAPASTTSAPAPLPPPARNLEPTRPRPSPDHRDDAAAAGEAEPLLFKLSMCQRLLDLAIQLLPDNNTSASAAARSAFGIVLRESFKVYDAFKDGLDVLLRSRAAAGKTAISKVSSVSAHEILKKACDQTPELKEFYHKCKKINVSKSMLEYPVVRVVTPSMDLIMPPVSKDDDVLDDQQKRLHGRGGGGGEASDEPGDAPFTSKLETTISTVWVAFDDGDDDDKQAAAAAGDGDDDGHPLQAVHPSSS
ncbi:hypothetical protein GUJ93_ZPchr0011g27118 [Zizania palustris]|uniref:AP180 N-terminal homology (ANTH) domain-containing protein n=1 Tax=Zizania palustris TaxID=103762 RepID=A0A8J5WEE9_ZIZPA|nr:hypothetical protein GUJ93_ZPchr0011g27118 [Zizania palustris]